MSPFATLVHKVAKTMPRPVAVISPDGSIAFRNLPAERQVEFLTQHTHGRAVAHIALRDDLQVCFDEWSNHTGDGYNMLATVIAAHKRRDPEAEPKDEIHGNAVVTGQNGPLDFAAIALILKLYQQLGGDHTDVTMA